jgi:hypothetical protein
MREICNLNNIHKFSHSNYIDKYMLNFKELIIINNVEHFLFTANSLKYYFIYIGNKEINTSNIENFVMDNADFFVIHHENNNYPAISPIQCDDYNNDKCVYLKYGYIHRDNDLPALYLNKVSYWCQFGFLHRLYAPSQTEFSKDHNEIFQFNIYGKQINIEDFDNITEKKVVVSINNKDHIEYSNSLGQKIYFYNNKIHREDDNPAFISGMMKIWYKNGLIHRDFKPAITSPDFRLESNFIKNGIKLTKEQEKREKIIGNVHLF